jgi:hypothetical protein
VRRWSTLLISLLLGVCLGCSTEPPLDPKETLALAKKRLDAARTVRFDLSSEDLPKTGVVLVSGGGVAKRPLAFRGRFRVATGGVAVTVSVVSVDGTLYARLPLTDRFVATRPERLGIPDPASLLHPERGLSSFLTQATHVRSVGKSRSGREVVEELRARLPARVLGRLLHVADPSATFHARFFVDEGTGQLRRASFRGPFYDATTPTTYTVVLDRYDEPATITRPR